MLDTLAIQQALKTKGLYPPEPSGQIDDPTLAGISACLENEHLNFENWSNDRMVVAMEQIICRDLGIQTGRIDGLMGPSTQHAFDVFDARSAGTDSSHVETWRDAKPDLRDADHPAPPAQTPDSIPSSFWPKENEAAMNAFFGAKGTNQVNCILPFPMRIAWDPTKSVSRYQCNAKVVRSMTAIWNNVKDYYGYEKIKELRLDMFGGCLNVRQMRGGTSWSIHSWGCAFDMDPERNTLKMGRDKATLSGPDYKKYWEFIYDQGAIGLGPERNYDWMHFQFARL